MHTHSSRHREADFFVNNLLDSNLLCFTDSLKVWGADLHFLEDVSQFAAVFRVTIAIVWVVRRLVIALTVLMRGQRRNTGLYSNQDEQYFYLNNQ